MSCVLPHICFDVNETNRRLDRARQFASCNGIFSAAVVSFLHKMYNMKIIFKMLFVYVEEYCSFAFGVTFGLDG